MSHPLLTVALGALDVAIEELKHQNNTVIGTKSTKTDVITGADRALEAAIKNYIRDQRPEDVFLGEEFGSSGEGETRWIIDPIDGTVNFTYGIPAYAISIAAEVDGMVEVGIVHDLGRDETFVAVAGQGVTLNSSPISASGVQRLEKTLCGTGSAYLGSTRIKQAQLVTQLIGEIRDIRRFGAAALDICWVGCARLDAYFETGLKIWDYAAASLVALEAGAMFETGLAGFDDGLLTIASASGIFELLKVRVTDAIAAIES